MANHSLAEPVELWALCSALRSGDAMIDEPVDHFPTFLSRYRFKLT
jgi:hypothetical protein